MFEGGYVKADTTLREGNYAEARKLIIDLIEDLYKELSGIEAPED